MKKHWLGGVLLGTSITLLLAGGVALAQGLNLIVDKACFQCWAAPVPTPPPSDAASIPLPPPVGYRLDLALFGYSAGEGSLCWQFEVDGDPVGEYCQPTPLVQPPATWLLWATCPDQQMHWFSGMNDLVTGDAAPQNLTPELPYRYGKWTVEVCQEEGPIDGQVAANACAEESFLFAADCAAALFVPEPAAMLLLGGGLVGLAGYAAARWRTRR